ncbi:hypothetical protein C8R44DRAFT_291896 [Mycena epipterygia]|nr:hypothetical protein C8R44DRAFT_291896 [Mycena epipterygia]
MTRFLRFRGFHRVLPPRRFQDTCALFRRSQQPPARFSSSDLTVPQDVQARNQSLVDSVQNEHYAAAERLRLHLVLDLTVPQDVQARNQSLVDSVQNEHYAAAERLRLHLVSEFAPIEPNPVYERAALAQIRWDGKPDLEAFLTWLHLVPDNQNPSRVERGPFTKTRNMLFRSGNPARHLILITEFSLVCAAKGYGQLVWDDLVPLMTRFQHADKAVAFFLAFEAALLQYHSKHHPSLEVETASRQRNLLIMLCCDAGWLEEAVQLVQDSTAHRIKQACDHLIDLLRAQNDMESVALVEKSRDRRIQDIPQPDTETGSDMLDPSKKLTTAQHNVNAVEPLAITHPPSPNYGFSTRFIIQGSKTLRSRTWIASQLRQVKRMVSRRSLTYYQPPGSNLHSFMAHYDVCKGYPRGLMVLRAKALSASDPCSYVWLCKEMFYLHESRKYADIVALFGANFRPTFLPPKQWLILRGMAKGVAEPWRDAHIVPTRLEISAADAWIIWNALVRLAVYVPEPLPVLGALHHSVVHYSSKLKDNEFRAFPTSYTAVFRSLIWAYGEIREVSRAEAAASDVALIGKTHASNVGLLDELAGVYARTGDVPAATRLLGSLEQLGPRLATYGVMIDAYLYAGLIDEASELELRMKQKCQYVPGVNWRMDATLQALRAAEEALDPDLT